MANDVKSNLEYLKSQTATISSTISSAQANCSGGLDSFASTTLCPSGEPAVVAAFLKCYNSMLNTLSAEMVQINEIGDGFERLDNVMASIATALPMEISSTAAGPVEVLNYDPKTSFDGLTANLDNMIVGSGLDKDAFAPKKPANNNQSRGQAGYGYPQSSGGFASADYAAPVKEQNTSTKTEPKLEQATVTDKQPVTHAVYQNEQVSATEHPDANMNETNDVEILDVNIETADENLQNEIPVTDSTDTITPEDTNNVNVDTNQKKSPMGTIGTIAGIGLAGAAAAAYGINKYKQNHDFDDDDDIEEDKEEVGDEE